MYLKGHDIFKTSGNYRYIFMDINFLQVLKSDIYAPIFPSYVKLDTLIFLSSKYP
jgi:hypothetical protein